MTKTTKMIASANDPAQRVRLPKPLFLMVKKAAKSAGRSKNSEIVKRLTDSFIQDAQKRTA